MSHFAEIDSNGLVLRVIVADQSFINSGAVGDPDNWVQTSYNTREGIHTNNGTPLRKNFAGIGFKYDSQRDAFIPPKLHSSFILNESKGIYEPPTSKPTDGKSYEWNEDQLDWTLATKLPFKQ